MADRLQLHTLAGCRLLIGRFPPFRYDARGGGGPGQRSSGKAGGETLCFPPDQLRIPPLNWRSTRFLGLPLPPGLQIAIEPEQLQGEWDPSNGTISLDFRARFRFSIGISKAPGAHGERAWLYRAPDLAIACRLSTGQAEGLRHSARGRPLNQRGEALLVGVARVAPSGDGWLDRFLGLPDDALAVLHCRLDPGAEGGSPS